MLNINWVHALSACLVLSLSPLTLAEPVFTRTPKIVYDSGRTVDAQPYFSKQRLSSETPLPNADVPPGPTIPSVSLDLADHLPLTSYYLSPGDVTVRKVKGLYTPFFVIGMDDHSLGWFNEALDVLVEMRAIGMVVEARDREKWLALQAAAAERGIRLSLLNGDSLATVYEFATYPAVFVNEDTGQ